MRNTSISYDSDETISFPILSCICQDSLHLTQRLSFVPDWVASALRMTKRAWADIIGGTQPKKIYPTKTQDLGMSQRQDIRFWRLKSSERICVSLCTPERAQTNGKLTDLRTWHFSYIYISTIAQRIVAHHVDNCRQGMCLLSWLCSNCCIYRREGCY